LVTQIIIYRVYVQIVQLLAERMLNERIKEYSKQGVDTVCPCARAMKHFIPIQLNTDNFYKCQDCDKNIAVNVEVKTFLETVPLDLDKTDTAFGVVYDKVTNQPDHGNTR